MDAGASASVLDGESAPPEGDDAEESTESASFRTDADTHAGEAHETDAADAAADTAADTASDDSAPEHRADGEDRS